MSIYILALIYLGFITLYTATHWYIIEQLEIHIKDKRWWTVFRAVFTTTYSIMAHDFSWMAVASWFFYMSLFWVVFNPLLNYIRCKPWDHVNADSYWDNLIEDQHTYLIVKITITLLLGVIYYLVVDGHALQMRAS